MRLKNLIEYVLEFHPGRSGPVIAFSINNALNDFCLKSRIYRKTVQIKRGGDGISFTMPSDWIATRRIGWDNDASEEGSDHTSVSPVAYNDSIPRLIGYDQSELQNWADSTVWSPVDDTTILIGTLTDGLFITEADGAFCITYEAKDSLNLTDEEAIPLIPDQYHEALAHRVIETFFSGEENVRQRSYHYARWLSAIKDAIRQRNEGGLADGWNIRLHEM